MNLKILRNSFQRIVNVFKKGKSYFPMWVHYNLLSKVEKIYNHPAIHLRIFIIPEEQEITLSDLTAPQQQIHSGN